MPEINLIPMMGVMLVVLAFFVFISMNLRGQAISGVKLPHVREGSREVTAPEPLIIGLNQQSQVMLNNQTVDENTLSRQVVAYLDNHRQGRVILHADHTTSYRQVVQLLKTLQTIGGDRVFLAIQPS